jgi:hypothetical protein
VNHTGPHPFHCKPSFTWFLNLQAGPPKFSWVSDLADPACPHDPGTQAPLERVQTPKNFFARRLSSVRYHLGLREHPMGEENGPLVGTGQPSFCLDLALRLLYWAELAYKAPGVWGLVDEAAALALFNLESMDSLSEPTTDTFAAMGWNRDAVVLAFRGTASVANILTDLKVHRHCSFLSFFMCPVKFFFVL